MDERPRCLSLTSPPKQKEAPDRRASVGSISAVGHKSCWKNRNSKNFGPCLVCGEQSSGVHYGVPSCEGCKGFFRRVCVSVEFNNTCDSPGQCSLQRSVVRTSCQFCRLVSCLANGMDPAVSKLGRCSSNGDQVRAPRRDVNPDDRVQLEALRKHCGSIFFAKKRKKELQAAKGNGKKGCYSDCPGSPESHPESPIRSPMQSPQMSTPVDSPRDPNSPSSCLSIPTISPTKQEANDVIIVPLPSIGQEYSVRYEEDQSIPFKKRWMMNNRIL